MKIMKICLALLVAISMFAGCTSRNKNNTSGAVVSEPPVVSSASSLADEAEDRLESAGSGVESGLDRLEDNLESGLNGNNSDGSRSDGSSLLNPDNSTHESIAPAMSTDFSEIGALDAEKKGWGSGGPTDDEGRPNGAALYQNLYGKYNAHFIAPSNKVYLTFDEGYENGYTPAILDTLKEQDAKAVFFITLDFAQRQPELVKRMVDEGHVLGNHSCGHLSFPDMPLQEAAADIMRLHEYVKENFGYEMTLFRPPMGEFNEQTLALAQSLGYHSVFWSFAHMDYDVNNQPITIEALDKITTKCHPGAIYLLHAVSRTNTEVLEQAIDNIRSLGFTIAKWDMY